jgi:hypothetical protein
MCEKCTIYHYACADGECAAVLKQTFFTATMFQPMSFTIFFVIFQWMILFYHTAEHCQTEFRKKFLRVCTIHRQMKEVAWLTLSKRCEDDVAASVNQCVVTCSQVLARMQQQQKQHSVSEYKLPEGQLLYALAVSWVLSALFAWYSFTHLCYFEDVSRLMFLPWLWFVVISYIFATTKRPILLCFLPFSTLFFCIR